MRRLFLRGSHGGPADAASRDRVHSRWRKVLYSAAGLGLFIAFTQLYFLSQLAQAPPASAGGDAITAAVLVVLSLSGAFWAILELRAREAVLRTRGRAIQGKGVSRHRETLQRLASGVVLAHVTLIGALGLMAVFEAAATGLAGQDETKNSDGARSSGELALAEARRVAEKIAADAEERRASDGGGDGSDSSGAAGASPGLVGPGRRADGSEEGKDAVRVGNLISDEPVMIVRSRTPLPTSSVHLRGLVLGEYDASGTLQERSAGRGETLLADAEGWVAVEGGAGTQGTDRGPLLALELDFPGPTNGVVYAPQRLRAVRAPEVLYAPASELYVVQSDDVSTFGFRSVLPALDLDELRSATARGSLGRLAVAGSAVELPRAAPDSPRAIALESLAGYARALTDNATNDFDRVVRVVEHLRNAFGYELFDASMLSPERCEELIQSGSGSCTHFASLAALLLRSQGIPTRIAIGYVAREPLPEKLGPGWLVRARDGHAWIEVHFAEYGWLYFDPTPGGETAGGAASGWAPLSAGSLAQLEEEQERAQRGPRTSSLGGWVLRALGKLLVAGKEALGRGGLIVAGAVTAIGMAWGAWRRRRRRRWGPEDSRSREETAGPHGARRPEGEPPTEPGARRDWEAARALMEGLATSGHRQGEVETPSAFARRVEAESVEARGLLGALRALMGRSSRGRRLTEVEVKAVRGVSGRLRGRDGEGEGESPPATGP